MYLIGIFRKIRKNAKAVNKPTPIAIKKQNVVPSICSIIDAA